MNVLIFLQKAYHQEWEDEKFMIYFPEHITEGYEAKAALAKAIVRTFFIYQNLGL